MHNRDAATTRRRNQNQQPGGNSANRPDIEACTGAANHQLSYLGAQTQAPGTSLSLRSTTSYPGGYLRQSAGAVHHQQNDTAQFKTDASFCPVVGNNGQGASLKWAGNPALYLRHYNGSITSWIVTPSWA